MKLPKWTVLSNLVSPGSPWIGTSWEFFDDETAAQERYNILHYQGHVPTKRPYYDAVDRQHVGAGHRLSK